MWIFIILVVVVVLVKFLYDGQRQNILVQKQGGMRNKYSELVNYILEGHNGVRVLRESSNSIDLGVSSAGGATSFFLTQTFGSLTVQWKMRSPIYGDHKLEWTFPEYLDQNKMLEKMTNDLQKYQTNVMNSKGW